MPTTRSQKQKGKRSSLLQEEPPLSNEELATGQSTFVPGTASVQVSAPLECSTADLAAGPQCSTDAAHALPESRAPTESCTPPESRAPTVDSETRTPSQRTVSLAVSQAAPRAATTRSERARSINEVREEITRLRLEAAEARLARLEAEEEADCQNPSGSEADDGSIRIEEWVDAQRRLTETRVESATPHGNVAATSHANPPPSTPLSPSPSRPPPPQMLKKPAGLSPSVLTDEERQRIIEIASAVAEATRVAAPPAASSPAVPHRYLFSELPAFNGSHEDWLAFRAAYQETSKHFSPTENTARLRHALRGKAKEAVQSLLIANTDPADILTALENRFGRPDSIAMAEMDRIRQLPRVSDLPRDVCDFANKIQNSVAVLRALNRPHYLHNPETARSLTEKLSTVLRHQWYSHYECKPQDEPDLVSFCNFIEVEARRCRHFAPPENIGATVGTTAPDRARHKQQRTFAVDEKQPRQGEPAACLVCKSVGHAPAKCPQLKKASREDRWAIAKKLRLCFRCLRLRTASHKCRFEKCGVDGCMRSHHSMLHYSATDRPVERPGEPETVASASCRESYSYLKMLPVRLSGPKGHVDALALLDDGSTVTLLEANVAMQIGAEGKREQLNLSALAASPIDTTGSRRVTLKIEGQGKQFTIAARTIQALQISPQAVNGSELRRYAHLGPIREHLVYKAGRPRVLIGQDNWHLLVANEMKRGPVTQPAASRTPLGWVLHGSCTRSLGRRLHTVHCAVEERMDDELKRFFSLESLGVEPKKTRADPEERALQLLREHTVVRPGGGYETCLPWRTEDACLPNNYDGAFKRLRAIERKLDGDPELRTSYNTQIDNLLERGYAEETSSPGSPGRTWYLPHFAVQHPSKPGKVRVVFDAAARTRGTSLNDHLLPGPDLLQSLPGVLMRFRQHPVAVAADIEEMFLRVGIREEDRDTLRFLWRGDRREGLPKQLRMKSVIFGAASSPCAALFVKNLNAEQYRAEYPEAAEAVIVHHYMDDYLQSFPTIKEALKIAAEVKHIHAGANFKLHKWTSNHRDVAMALREASAIEPAATTDATNAAAAADIIVTLNDGSKEEKVLGLVWRPATDTLGFNMSLARIAPDVASGERTPTKREALQLVMSVFDPLGLASPVTIQAKKILQETWRMGVEWDHPLPEPLAERWRRWLADLTQLRHLSIPRCHAGWTKARRRELHTFVDASETAYAASVYWRTIDAGGRVEVSLATAKTRVTPLKITSVPRLELQAAVLGCRLAATAGNEYQAKPDARYFWSDSLTVLKWLQAGPRTLKTFVAHRVAEIEENTSINEWRWLPTQHNAADDATRDVPSGFTALHRWFTGPQFLAGEQESWPVQREPVTVAPTGEERTCVVRSRDIELERALPDIDRFSAWHRLMRATARVLQFIQRLRRRAAPHQQCHYKRTARKPEADASWGKMARKGTPITPRVNNTSASRFIPLEAELMRAAEELWVHASQKSKLGSDIDALKKGAALPQDSRLRNLAVFIDPKGTLRLKSRIDNAENTGSLEKSPAILDGDHRIARLYIDQLHRRLHHGGVEMVVNEVRAHYWVLRLRSTVKTVLKTCLRCRLIRAAPAVPPTGDHPSCRLAHHRRPFTFVGLDYFGPLSVTVGRRHEKRYVALFTCLTTRAVHLEIAETLSADSALMALRRMIARRGSPEEICSDNGTNFKGASRELHQAVADEAATRAIRWRFIPPGAPFMGGAWERLVRSVKTALYRVLTDRHPHVETLSTLLCEVEYTVNSRPLTHVSTSPEDLDALTPNHFLMGGSGLVQAPGDFTDSDLRLRAKWRCGQRLADIFWERWLREYLPELQHRREPHGRGDPLRIGDIVLIVDTSSPRNTWPRGKVVRLYPGRDGVVRVADVETNGGVLRRATKRLVVLPTRSTNTLSLPADDCSV